MSLKPIVFSPRARQGLEEIADYLSRQKRSNAFVLDYSSRFENHLNSVLGPFPESGTPMPEYGKDVRRVVHRECRFLDGLKNDVVEILPICRENLP